MTLDPGANDGGEAAVTEEQRAADVRASDDEREEVVERLRQASAEARLTLAELAERSDAAYHAKTRGELASLTADLPAPAPAGTAPAEPERKRAPSRWIVSVMGGSERRGRWRPAEELNVVAVMGGSDIDLRGAEVAAAQITITAVAFMGGIDVIVPEGVEVELDGFDFMGGHDQQLADVPRRPGTPHVRVRSVSVMGGVTVKSKPSRSDDER